MSLFYLLVSFVFFTLCVVLWICFDPYLVPFQYVSSLKYSSAYIYFGLDGISLFFIFSTCLCIPLCILFTWTSSSISNREYIGSIFCVGLLLHSVFSVLHLFFFYVFFESIIIPFFLMIGLHGSRDRKTHAFYLLFFHTVFGSFFMLVSILVMYMHTGSTHYQILWGSEFSSVREHLLWLSFFMSFAIKVPIYPFHIWLPEAHVESPTEGSVLLAAVLLKVGGYGFPRILLPCFPEATNYFSSVVLSLCILSIIYSSLSTMRQIDIKRIIAYSSIAHMNVCILGIILHSTVSLSGSLLLMFGHGVVSGGLFFIVGALYDRFRTKLVLYYSGLYQCMPLLSMFSFLFISGNISLPGTCNFIGEFLVFYGTFLYTNWIGLFSIAISILLCSFYSLYLYNRVVFGFVNKLNVFKDLTLLELSVLLPLVFFMFFIGINPSPFFYVISMTCNYISFLR